MSSLFNRSAILVFARIANYAVIFLSPMFLVRILDVSTYGQYREFVLYALLLAMLFGFSINGSLLYFLPKDLSNENKYVTNTVLFLLITTTLGSVVVLLFDWFYSIDINFGSVFLLILYVFFFVNMDMLESYWLAKKRSDYVFLYSTVRVVVRISAVIISAYLTRSVEKIVYVMIVVEVVRSMLVFLWVLKNKLLSVRLDKELIKDQLKYILPLGAAGQIFNLNQKAGGLFIVSQFGPEMLAIYTIGTFQLPIISIVRTAVSDVIFPDVVKQTNNNDTRGLDLWQRANVFFCFLVFPVFFVFFVNAEIFITTLFTSAYIQAATVFQLMLLIMLRQCFEMGIPLRARNKNSQFMFGNILALILNVSILSVAYDIFGISGPAIALVLADLFLALYMGRKIVILYSITWAELFLWKNVIKLMICALLPLPVLVLGSYYSGLGLLGVVLSSAIYCIIYFYLVRRMNLKDVDLFVLRVKSRLSLKNEF